MKTETLGKTIARLRKEQGMTQLELADLMGVTDKAVSKWERDLSCPDINSFPQLAKALHTSADELLQIKTEPMPEKKKITKEIISLSLKGIAAAMGVAVTVLTFLGEADGKSALIMLGIGLAALAVSSLKEKE